MASFGTYFVEGLLAVTYIFLTIQKKNSVWWVFAIFFVFLAVLVKSSFDIVLLHDFRPYFASFLDVKYGGVQGAMLFEPYRLLLFKAVLFFHDVGDLDQIGIIYWFHFFAITGFFLWLAYLKEVTFEAKLFLFLAFYPTMAFVWLRAGMAYAVSCFLFFAVKNVKYRALHYLAPLIHSSVLPLVGAMKIRTLSTGGKVLVVSIAAVAAYLLVETSYAQYILYKLDYYSGTADQRTSTNLLLFHIANTLVFVYLAVINSKFRKNFAVGILMGTYLSLYFLSPVVALRTFPLVLIACIAQRISFPRYQLLTLIICLAYLPVYFGRFDQVLL